MNSHKVYIAEVIYLVIPVSQSDFQLQVARTSVNILFHFNVVLLFPQTTGGR